MVQKSKLDLTNYRGAKTSRTPYVFDSSLMIDVDGNRKNTAVKFSTHYEKIPLRIPAQSTLDPIITPRGSLWEIKEIVVRKDCAVKMDRKTAADRVVEERPRLDTPCMNRVMSKSYNVAGVNNVYERVLAGKVPGGKITATGMEPIQDKKHLRVKTPPPLPIDPRMVEYNENGSVKNKYLPELWKVTDYDTTRWSNSRWGHKDNCPVFSTAPSGRGADEPNVHSHTGGKYHHHHDDGETCSASMHKDYHQFDPDKGRIVKGKFSTASADRNELKVPFYVKTGGMKLAPDYDWGDSTAAVASGVGGNWLKRAVKVNSGLKQQRPDPPRSDTIDIEIPEIDCKLKFCTSSYSKFSPITYQSAFSKTKRGFKPNPTTAPWVGPGAYPGVEKHEINGGKFTKTKRDVGGKLIQDDDRPMGARFVSFGEANTAGISFPQAGNPGKSRTRLQMEKIYPKLAEDIYNPKPKFDIRNQKAVVAEF